MLGCTHVYTDVFENTLKQYVTKLELYGMFKIINTCFIKYVTGKLRCWDPR